MANPVFGRNDMFNGAALQPGYRQPQQAVTQTPVAGVSASAHPTSTIDAAQLEAMYARPSAGPRETGRMTYDDVIVKTAFLFAVVVAAGALTWVLAPQLFWVGAIAGLALGLVNSFRHRPSRVLITAYAACQGVALGGISAFFEAAYPGIVVQAVLATSVTFGVTLALYAFRVVRVTAKFLRYVLIAMIGYLLFLAVNFVLTFFGATGGAFSSSVTVGGIPLGAIIGVGAVLLAAACLMIDFNAVERGIEAGAPAEYAWTASFGLTVTMVWMYLEILRLLSYFRN